ncbi:MAG: hypothetical protein RBQ97_10840 [Acholeplasma sp.]|nr:hypothetical protein [Acholeplasma sp.]
MTLEERFERFWKAYPKKVGKLDCLKIFNRRKYDEQTVIKMIQALEWQKYLEQWQNKKYIPNPSTWLNQGRWLDEMDESLMVKQDEKKHKDPEWMDDFVKELENMEREGK